MAHKSPTEDYRVAIAPYNFVRLPDEIALPPQVLDEYNQDVFKGLSGYINLDFKVLSPLYIRGMMNPKEYLIFGKNKLKEIPKTQREQYLKTIAKFFSYDNHHRIPGSSLRGMFRTIIEVISFSKPYEVTDKKIRKPGRGNRRFLYQYTPKDLMPDYITQGQIENENEDCSKDGVENKDVFDLSELLFGFVRKSGNSTIAKGGRVFFEDGLVKNPGNKEERIPKILGTPKPSAYPIYLEQSTPDNPDNLHNYDDDNTTTQIRGNKFYWSKGNDPIWWTDNITPNLETRITPISPGANFYSRIRFENLTKVELGSLLWVIDLGHKETHCLRLGMGKPYGLGAVRISDFDVHFINREDRYNQLGFSEEEGEKEIALEIKVQPIKDKNKALGSYIDDFKAWVKEKIMPIDQNFEDNIRIQGLMKLHEWIKCDDPKRGYMTLQQYGNKRVLPNALEIENVLPDFLVPGPKKPNTQQSLKSSDQHIVAVSKEPIDPTRPLGQEFKVGNRITVRIDDLSDSELIFCKFESLHDDNQAFVIRKKHATNRKINVGEPIRCRISEIEEDKEEEVTYIYLIPLN